MLFINYKGNIPQQRFYSFAVQGNNNANKVRFVLARQQADIDLDGYVCNLKVENKEAGYKDLIMLNLVQSGSDELIFEWTMSNKSTQFRTLELQLEFLSTENANDVVWQTMIVEFELSNTIKVGDERPTDEELSVLKQVEREVKTYDNRITQNEEDIAELQAKGDFIVLGNPNDYLNENGLKKIIRPQENGSVTKSYMVDKIHHKSTLITANANTSGEVDGETLENHFNLFVNIFGGSQELAKIFGQDYGGDEFGHSFIVNKEHDGETTYGVRIGDVVDGFGFLGLIDCEPNKIIRVTVGKYFEYDEQGNKVFDEHCVFYSVQVVGEEQISCREITEERQVFEMKTSDNGHLYFGSDGEELGFGNTRFILYGFETGEPAYDEYKPKELGQKTLPVFKQSDTLQTFYNYYLAHKEEIEDGITLSCAIEGNNELFGNATIIGAFTFNNEDEDRFYFVGNNGLQSLEINNEVLSELLNLSFMDILDNYNQGKDYAFQDGLPKAWYGTQHNYDNMPDHDANTTYYIYED